VGGHELAVKPAYLHIPDYDTTDGDQVAGLCEEVEYGPDADQRMCLDAIFGRDPRGKSAAFESWIIACRQNVKTSTGKMAVLGWTYLYRADPVIWTAHEWDAVAEVVNDLDAIMSGSRWLARQVRYFRHGERDQEIGLVNGARVLFKTRTPGGGRALTGEKVVLDEGWKVRESHMGSLLPTLSARSITGDPQVLGLSSAAHEDSEVLHPVIARGRAAAGGGAAAFAERRLFYAEWCAPPPEIACRRGAECDHGLDTPGCGCDDPVMIAAANPALGRRISLDYVLESERRPMPPHQFGRERMGWHDKPVGAAKVIPLTEWADGLDPASEPAGAVTLCVVWFRSKRAAAIGLAGVRADGDWHVEVADIVAPSRVVTRVAQIIARAAGSGREVGAVAVDPRGYEGACLQGLEDVREADAAAEGEMARLVEVRIVPARRDEQWAGPGRWPLLVRMTAADVAAAYSGFFTSVTDARDLHHRGQDDLTLALVGATARPVGDAGEAWGRRKSGADIAPLVAVTGARWVHQAKIPAAEVVPGAWAL